ncbi:MAG: hypothetical protein J5I98_33860, partial [Phaeodactylibacter sp.]|nr:hypothetical protein [Phaeodactylibacter sp.]
RQLTSIIRLLLSLLLIAVFIWAIWQGYSLLVKEQRSIDPGTQSLIIIVAILAISCTYMLASALRKGAAAIARGRLQERKLEAYRDFLSAWPVTGAKGGQDRWGRVRQKMSEHQATIALLADADVLRAWNRLRIDLQEGATAQEAFEELVYAMRFSLDQPDHYSLKTELHILFSSPNT